MSQERSEIDPDAPVAPGVLPEGEPTPHLDLDGPPEADAELTPSERPTPPDSED